MRENLTRRETQLFVVVAIAVSIQVWDIAFNLGVYGTIFYDKLMLFWVVSTVVLMATIIVPPKFSPVRGWKRWILLLPTVWLFLIYLDVRGTFANVHDLVEWVLVVAAVGINLALLPYALYVVGRLTNEDMFRIHSQRLVLGLVIITLVIFLAGVLMGANSQFLVSCEEFAVAGAGVPPRCQ